MYDHSASPEPFDAADAAFRLLCAGPQPLAVYASKIAAGLPDRPVPLDELRVLLLHPSTGARARNQVWAELVRRARAGDPAWVIGLAGIAMPGLRRAAGSLAATYHGDPADLQAEVLTGFLAAVHALDPDDLESVPLASRLCWAAWRAGQQLACADAGWASRRHDLAGWRDGPDLPWGHPDFVLAAAVVELDTLLVMLMGAVDASARFIHLLLGLQGQQREAGWQKPGWRSQLTGQNQPLADLFASGTPLADLLTILSRLRSTVHGQAIQAALRQKGSVRDAPITLPTENESQILACMENLGGQAAWGAQPAAGAAVAVDPGQFVERLFPAVLDLLNAVMAATPPANAGDQRPRPDSAHPWYNERNRLSVSWQLGL